MCYFVFSVTLNRDFGKFMKIISQRVLVKLQTDTVFPQSLSNSYDEFFISRILFFHNTTQRPEVVVDGSSVKGYSEKFHNNQGENTGTRLSISVQLQP